MATYFRQVNHPHKVEVSATAPSSATMNGWTMEQQQAWLALICAGDALVAAFKNGPQPVDDKKSAWDTWKNAAPKIVTNDDRKPDGHAFVNHDQGIDCCMSIRGDGSICAWPKRYHKTAAEPAEEVDDGVTHTGVHTYHYEGMKAATSAEPAPIVVPQRPTLPTCAWCGDPFDGVQGDLCSELCLDEEIEAWERNQAAQRG